MWPAAIGLLLLLALHLILPPIVTPVVHAASTPAVGQATDRTGERDWPLQTERLTPDPAIHFGSLDNGFRYVLMHNQRPQHRVSVHLVIGAGSLNEKENERGVAHFLEHMMFNGTRHFPPGQLVRYFQRIGMQFGNDANAHTGFDQTVYDLLLPDGSRQHLEQGLEVMADYAAGALLLEEEVRNERGVILAEMRSRDSADFRTLKATLAFEFPNLLLSERLPIGVKPVIRSADRDLLKTFYDAWYRPDNMVLVMVGDVDVAAAASLVRERFRTLAPRGPRVAKPPFGTIDHRGLKVFYHHEPEVGSAAVSIEAIHSVAPQADGADARRRRLTARMADQIVQNRLDARLNDPQVPFTAAHIGSGDYLERIRYSEIAADCNPAMWAQSLTAIEQELRRAQYFGFSQTELDRVKKDILTAMDNAVREAATRDSTAIARSIIGDLRKKRVVLSPAQEQALLAPIVEKTDVSAVEAAFHRNWSSHHRLVLVSGNADIAQTVAGTPEAAIREAFLASAATVVQPPAAAAVKPFPYLPEPATSGAVASRESITDLGITRVRFDNGITLNLKQTDFKRNEVLASLTFGGGRAGEPENLPVLALLTEATLNESGLGAMDADALSRALAGMLTDVELEIEERFFKFSAESVSGELPLLFQLLHAHLVDPGLRKDAMLLARRRLVQEYRSASRSIEGMMRIEGARMLAGGDSRFGIPSLEAIQAIDLDDIRQWIAPQLAHAPLELSIVGDIDPETVIALAQRYLGSLPDRSPDGVAADRRDLPAVPVGSTHRIAVDTQIAKALVVAAWPTTDFDDIHGTRRLAVLSDVFSERLRERIRENLGIAYSPYAFNRASRAYPGYGVFQAHVNVPPDQTDAIQAELRAIAASLSADGITADELKRAVDPILTGIKAYRQTNGYWLNSVMTGAVLSPEQLEWARTFVDDYAAITTDELDRLADIYLKPARAAMIVIVPEKIGGEDP